MFPELENVMINMMRCSKMIIGAKTKYIITFKYNQKHFKIFRKMYNHMFKSTLNTEDFSRSLCKDLSSKN